MRHDSEAQDRAAELESRLDRDEEREPRLLLTPPSRPKRPAMVAILELHRANAALQRALGELGEVEGAELALLAVHQAAEKITGAIEQTVIAEQNRNLSRAGIAAAEATP